MNKDLTINLNKLKAIKKTSAQAEILSAYEIAIVMLLFSLIVAVAILIFDLMRNPYALSVALLAYLMLAARFVWYRKKRPEQIKLLDSLLSDYEPIDIDGYKDLQRRVQVDGSFDCIAVRVWASMEEESVKLALAENAPRKFEFTKKQVPCADEAN